MLQMLVSDLIAFEQVFAVHQLMKGLDTRFPTSNPKAFQTIMKTLRDNHQRIRVTFMRDRLEEGAVASQYRVSVLCLSVVSVGAYLLLRLLWTSHVDGRPAPRASTLR